MCFRNVRLTSTNRLSPGPNLSVLSCSGHSPPLSQIGQSSGWFASSSSRIDRWPARAFSDVVWTTMPSAASKLHDAASFGAFSISTRHTRHAPSGAIRSW